MPPNQLNDKTQKASPTTQHISQAANPPIGTVTSSFFVSMDEVFSVSNVGAGESKGKANVEKAVQLLWFTSVEERVSQGNMASDFQASATLSHSLLEMHIQTDSAMPTLRQNLRNNTPIKKIKITRVGNLGEDKDNTEMYSTTFTNCFIETIEEFPDKLIVKARINTRSDTAAATKYDATQGTTSGSTASGWDYAQNTAMA
jgi:type VI protein secretion system component Hcp